MSATVSWMWWTRIEPLRRSDAAHIQSAPINSRPMMRSGILQHMRAAGLVLALFALAFKAMLPPGFMLSAGDSGAVVVQLCGGGEALLDPDGTGHDPQKPSALECPFAFTSASLLTAPALTPPSPSLISINRAAAPIRYHALTVADAGPPLPARGPPAYA